MLSRLETDHPARIPLVPRLDAVRASVIDSQCELAYDLPCRGYSIAVVEISIEIPRAKVFTPWLSTFCSYLMPDASNSALAAAMSRARLAADLVLAAPLMDGFSMAKCRVVLDSM